jgi:hypothetical protein
VYPFSGIGVGEGEDVQVFVDDGSIAADQPFRKLMVEVFALVGNLAAQLGNPPSDLLMATTTLLRTGKAALRIDKFILSLVTVRSPLTGPLS